MKQEKKLSDIPSVLIRQALNDLRACEQDDRYSIEMYKWHHPNIYTNKCEVCLAGAVMAQSLGADVNVKLDPHYSEDETVIGKLKALDSFREGKLSVGLDFLDIDFKMYPKLENYAEIALYAYNKEDFHKDMEDLAQTLEESGL